MDNDYRNKPVTGYPVATSSAQPQPQPVATNTAYPYAAPPPPPPQPFYYSSNPNYYPPNSSNPTQRPTFFRRFFAVVVAATIITGTILFIIWLILRPRLPEFRVDSFSVSNFNLSNSLLSSNFDVQFTAYNPNKKMSLFYDPIVAAVFYGSDSLSETTVAPFDQGKKNQTSLRATFAASGAYVEARVVNGINGERSRGGSVGFNLRMVARVRFKAGAWRARRRYLRVYCGDLSVAIESNGTKGTLVGGPRECRVGL